MIFFESKLLWNPPFAYFNDEIFYFFVVDRIGIELLNRSHCNTRIVLEATLLVKLLNATLFIIYEVVSRIVIIDIQIASLRFSYYFAWLINVSLLQNLLLEFVYGAIEVR